MANGKVAINADVVNQSLSQIVNSCVVLESDVSGKIPGNFQVLSELGLLPSALTKLEKQSKELVDVHKSLTTEIATHLEGAIQTEEELYNELNDSNGRNNYYNDQGSSSSNEATGSDTNVDHEEDGKEVNAAALIEAIPKIDEKTFIELLEFLNINKDEKTSFIDLLLDTKKSEELFVLLRKAFGKEDKLENVTLEDYKKVQKTLLDAIFTNETTYQELDENSILVAKEYLVYLSKKENINPSDLLLEDKYKEALKEGLNNLYDGDVTNDTSSETIEKFRDFIDKKAKENNIDANILLTENLEMIL